MPNYYTTRFRLSGWPPDGGAIPPGVEPDDDILREHGLPCCPRACIVERSVQPSSEPWTFVASWRIACPSHGDGELAIPRRVEWISPNEYMID